MGGQCVYLFVWWFLFLGLVRPSNDLGCLLIRACWLMGCGMGTLFCLLTSSILFCLIWVHLLCCGFDWLLDIVFFVVCVFLGLLRWLEFLFVCFVAVFYVLFSLLFELCLFALFCC